MTRPASLEPHRVVPPQSRTELIAALNAEGTHACAVQFTAQGAESWRADAV